MDAPSCKTRAVTHVPGALTTRMSGALRVATERDSQSTAPGRFPQGTCHRGHGYDLPMSRTMKGAVVAVVGTGGLGRALTASLAARGASVIVAGRSGTVDVPLDLTDAEAGAALVEHALIRHGRLDGVVIAAGVVAFGDLADTDDAVIEELMLVNAVGPLWLAKRVLPALRESRGFLANLSGVVASSPVPGMAAYSASKAAAAAGFQALGRELRRAGVLVCDAQPPHTETPLATRPIAGTGPRFAPGLDPRVVADRVVTGIETGQAVIAAADF